MRWIIVMILQAFVFAQPMVRFVATGDDSANLNKNLAYSFDGRTWTGIAGIFNLQGNNVAYGLQQRRWVASGSGTNTLAWSNNGIQWTGIGLTPFSTEARGIFYSKEQNLWVAMGQGTNTIASSSDGKAWTGRGSSIFTTRGQDVAYAPILNRWVAVGEGTNTIAHSTNGITWTGLGLLIFTIPVSTKPLGLSYSPSTLLSPTGQFQIVGLGNIHTQAYSFDGLSWTGTGSLFSNTIQDAAYGQNKWVVTGPPTPNPTPFANSTTGTSWVVGPQMINLLDGGRGLTYSSDLDLWAATGFGTTTTLISSDNANVWIGGDSGSRMFSITGYGISAGGFSDPLPPVVTNLIANSSIVEFGNSSSVINLLDVQGDLNVVGQLNLSSTAFVQVNTSFVTPGTLSVNLGAGIQCDRLKIPDGGVLELIIPSSLTVGTVANVEIVKYSQVVGVYTLQMKTDVFDSTKCISGQAIYGSTTLSVLLSVQSCVNDQLNGQPPTTGPGGGGTTRSADNTGMIIGIVIGVFVVGVAVAVVIMIVTKKGIAAKTAQKNAELKQQSMADLKRLQTTANLI